jgi:putative glutamine amidotransferase
VTARRLIGISTSEVREAGAAVFPKHGEPPRRELALGVAYMQAIERAGGIPVMLAPVSVRRIPDLLGHLQGVCLSGGPDIHPSAYGGENHPELGPTVPDLDDFEIALARATLRRGLPLLAICRGAQLLNVARGGTLIQHLPERVGDSIQHRQPGGGTAHAHPVLVERESRLGRIVGHRLDVNSFHHQAVDRLGAGLRAVAWAPDGMIEAIEGNGPGFTVGVQWHAECMHGDAAQERLFGAFVKAVAGESAMRRAA